MQYGVFPWVIESIAHLDEALSLLLPEHVIKPIFPLFGIGQSEVWKNLYSLDSLLSRLA